MADTLAVNSNILDHKVGISDRQAALAFGLRIRERAREIDKTSSEISRLTGIKKQSMTGYWNGERLCGTDKLFALSDALRVRARWLISGEGPKALDNQLVDANDAEMVSIPRYDLRNFGDAGKGASIDIIPFRRDWLNRRLFTSTGLWLIDIQSDYDGLGLAEGDVVICSDIDDAGPQDNWTCLFRDDHGIFAARYIHAGGADGWRLGRVSASDIAAHKVYPVARIHARILARL